MWEEMKFWLLASAFLLLEQLSDVDEHRNVKVLIFECRPLAVHRREMLVRILPINSCRCIRTFPLFRFKSGHGPTRDRNPVPLSESISFGLCSAWFEHNSMSPDDAGVDMIEF